MGYNLEFLNCHEICYCLTQFSKCDLGIPLNLQDAWRMYLPSQNYFQNITEMLFAFFTLIVSCIYNGVFLELHDV